MQLLKKSNDIIMNDSPAVTLSPAWNPVGFISSSNGIGIRLLSANGTRSYSAVGVSMKLPKVNLAFTLCIIAWFTTVEFPCKVSLFRVPVSTHARV